MPAAVDDKNEAVAQKIRKLLALSEGNANEHEREVAMQFALELLNKHNLEMADVQGCLPASEVIEFESEIRVEKWVHSVLSSVCMLYNTNYYKTVRKTARFVGIAENVAVSIDVARWLVASIRKESNRLYADSYMRRSFRAGAAMRIFMRACELVETEEAHDQERTRKESNPSRCTSLAVMNKNFQEDNEKFMSKLDLRQTRSRTTYVDGASFDSGSAFAGGVPLGRQTKRISDFS
ncbi:MAG: DUF2786 domain-containing protein [Candidatus Melainabacteria bacterium]|nr:DUF2786 domain-containing protein [Candidatus Melainabacteria bacterium]